MDGVPGSARHRTPTSHYYGGIVRGLFLSAATLMFVAGFTAAKLPLTPFWAVSWIIALVVIAALTNPVQRFMQWMNVIISVAGILVFGGDALSRFSGIHQLLGAGLFIALITLTLIAALYYATKTLRAHLMHSEA